MVAPAWYSSKAEKYLSPSESRERIIEVAHSFIGETSVKYTYNHPELGQSPQGFDCSGFARFVLIQAGFHIPDFIGMDDTKRPIRHTNEFWDHYGVATQRPESGDLIFFSRHGEYPTHMGIVNDEETYVHAPGTSGTRVMISRIAAKAIRRTSGANKSLYTTNPIGYKAPTTVLQEPTYRYHQSPL